MVIKYRFTKMITSLQISNVGTYMLCRQWQWRIVNLETGRVQNKEYSHDQ